MASINLEDIMNFMIEEKQARAKERQEDKEEISIEEEGSLHFILYFPGISFRIKKSAGNLLIWMQLLSIQTICLNIIVWILI